jgi:hypothetical protein
MFGFTNSSKGLARGRCVGEERGAVLSWLAAGALVLVLAARGTRRLLV